MKIYQDFAEVYDELMDNTPYAFWGERLDQLIRKYGISKPERDGQGCSNVQEWREPDQNAERLLDTEQTTKQMCGSGRKVQQLYGSEQDTHYQSDSETQERLLISERNLVVDLGCGTGTLAELMYQKGYDMMGVDMSGPMLNIAMEKKEKSGSEILYLQQDMRELELYSTVGTIYSVCDSLNYILEEDELKEVFSLVNNYLFPGGIFIFDFNTDYKYREVIGDTTIAENREDCSFIWENFYDPEDEINEYDLTVFVREEGDIFRRFAETHFQRGYRVEQMLHLVEAAGMTVVEVMDADTGEAVTDSSERVYVVARECGKTAENVV